MPKRWYEWRDVWRRQLFEAAGSARYSRPALHDLDRKLAQYLDCDSGFFVEAGAHDGYKQSNTYYLERFRRWRGVLIEPVPELFERCRRLRRESRVVRAALVERDFAPAAIELEYGDLMTIVPEVHGDAAARAFYLEMRTRYLPGCQPYRFMAPARTLSSILDEYGADRTVDFLSLDVEGFEARALGGLDLARHRPRFICVETWNKPKVDALLAPHYDEVAILHAEQHHSDVLYRARRDPSG